MPLSTTLRRPLTAAALAPLAFGLAACGSDGSGGSGDVTVVAGAYPFAYVVERIGGTMVDVDNLTQPGVEPHDVELTAKQLGALTEADLVVYLHGFQQQLDDGLDETDLPDEARLDVADVVDLLDATDDGHTEHSADDHADEHDGEDGDEHDHDHGGTDPHVWLDPQRMTQIADAVADRLAEIDPDNADAYRANADKLDQDLTTLDQEFRTGLKTCETRSFVTSHAAFGYLADAYDLTQIPIAGIEPNTEPSTQQLATIVDLVKNEGITTIFTEELTSPRTADTIARETGATTAVLSPIEGLTDDTADEDYFSLMRENLAALQEANRCS